MLENIKHRLLQHGIDSKTDFISEAFSRNIGILSKEDMEILSKARIAIPGMGGVGGLHLITLTRLGIGRFNIADFDRFDVVNINRQYGAKVSNFGKGKVHCMAKEALDVNPFLEIRVFDRGISPENLDEFLDGVDIVVDGLDFFEFNMRRLVFNKAREKGIYVITAAPLGFGTGVLVFSPNKGMSFDEYFDIYTGMPELEKYLNFALGLAPKGLHIKYIDKKQVDLEAKKGPSSIIACNLCAAMAGFEVVKILLNKGKVRPVPFYYQFDPYREKFVKGCLRNGNRNIFQRIKKYIIKNYILKLDTLERITPPPPPVWEKGHPFSKEIIEYLLKAGTFAPSGDNAQPWKFAIRENNIYLYLDPKRDESFFNVDQIASIISCGAVIENIKIASTMFNIVPAINFHPDPKDKDLMAIMDFASPKDCEKDDLVDYIWVRHTNRKFFTKKQIDKSKIDNLYMQIQKIPGARLKIITNRSIIKKIAKLIYEVDRIRVEFRPLHEHLMRMIRFNDRHMYETRDGLPIKNLEAGTIGEIFLKLTRPWSVMEFMNKIGLGKLIAHHSLKGINSSSGIGLITVDGSDRSAFLKGGMAMQRVWLEITKNGLYFQPMTAITLFWERWKRDKDSFLTTHKEMLKSIWPKYENLFELNLDADESHIMLFRFGYAKSETRVRTLRRELDNFLVSGPS